MAEPINLFGGLGIDTRSQEEIIAANQQARRQELDMIRQQGGNAGAVQAAGAQIGDAFGRTFGGAPQVSPEQQKMIDMNKRVQARMEESREKGEFITSEGTRDSLAEAESMQRIMAEELMAAGDERGIMLLQQLDTLSRGRKQQDAELDRLDAATQSSRAQAAESRVRAANGRIQGMRGRVQTYFRRGETDPNASFQGIMTEDGTGVVGPDGQIIPMAEVTSHVPLDPLRASRASRTLTANDYGISDSEAKAFRSEAGAISQQMRGAIRMKRALADAIGQDGSLNIMDGAGKVTSAVTTALDFVGAAARQIELSIASAGGDTTVGITDGDFAGQNLQGRGAARSYAKENLEDLDGLMRDMVPPHLRNNAIQRAEFYATLTQLVYARARTNEPGARQLSDADFKNAMANLAGNVSDPEAFRQVMMGNIMQDWQNFNDRYTALPAQVRDGNMVISAEGQRNYQESYDTFLREFGVGDFGSAAETSPELQSAAGDQAAEIAAEVEAAGIETEEVKGTGTAEDPIIL
jgi:hypothetical protein